jgi:hypothetical protein
MNQLRAIFSGAKRLFRKLKFWNSLKSMRLSQNFSFWESCLKFMGKSGL